jgi:hypothetical protein
LEITDVLEKFYKSYIPACFWLLNYLSDHKEFLIAVILESNYFEIRENFGEKLLKPAILNVSNLESD